MADSCIDSSSKEHTLEIRGRLREKVMHLVKPFRFTTNRPPFALRDLIVFALVAREEENANMRTIIQWIFDNFDFDANTENHSVYNSCYENHGEPEKMIEGFIGALMNVDTPISVTSLKNETGQEKDRYAVSTDAARFHLNECTQPIRKGKIPFPDLPPELRNRIYKLLFVYSTPLSLQLDIMLSG
ncbi:uncharacterized protein MYCFIDRAFT_179568 [Pseudocercospora fijiensis CIRAD86]|uniref:Fork-head domain-containing protein n=1 Tax=Pseudocercospora fijiensis (strain CIRAD86) TaxID=383855 RepID=M3ALU7_PSEFD|nr:uncharacterized protein MYCFIDRAFT_179568 [Pseudocercospora fijiensis CIRAD86]EME78123.1 hypothetical protein MYCFIDRAFT_179568 [Pseudocercospora fijiensis CIRAD86]